jgi:energy-coupling factor transporter ATP-binding protein EcfA2
MKRFTVRPRTFRERQVIMGAQDSADEWVWAGRLAEAGPLIDIRFDLGSEHVVSIFGKRGSGKSYTLGVLLEGLCARQDDSSIAHTKHRRAALLFDTLGIFQWTDIPLTDEASRSLLRQQYAVRKGWKLEPEPLSVDIWLPPGGERTTTPAHHRTFTIQASAFPADDWGYLLGLDIYRDRMGQLLADAFAKVCYEGWSDGSRRHHPQEQQYTLDDLVTCVEKDTELETTYQAETRRAVRQQLTTFRRNPLFQDEGTPLGELLVPGRLAVLVMSRMSEALRFVVMSALIRQVMKSRVVASELEKDLQLRSELSDGEREAIRRELDAAVPPTWIVIDEAQNVLPAERRTSATGMLVKLVREGRNFGLSFMFTTQQPSAVDARILAQVDTIITHKLTVQTDIDYVRRNLKSNLPAEVKYAGATLSFDELLRTLDVGQALVSNTETDRAFLLTVRPRVSAHGGFAPGR